MVYLEGFPGGCFFSCKNKAAQLGFAKLHHNKPQDLCNSVLCADVTKVEMFAHNAQRHTWRAPNTSYPPSGTAVVG